MGRTQSVFKTRSPAGHPQRVVLLFRQSGYDGRRQNVRRTGCPDRTSARNWSSISTVTFSRTFQSCRSISQFPPFPQTLGLSESRRQSQSTLRPHQMLSEKVRESPPVSIHAETPSNGSDWRVGAKFQSELPGPPLRVTARQEQVGSAALSGHPFSLKFLVYASCFSTSAGSLVAAYRVSSRVR